MIDTSSTKPVQQFQTQKSSNASMKVEEEVKTGSNKNNFGSNQNEVLDMGLAMLMELKENDLAGNDGQYRDTV